MPREQQHSFGNHFKPPVGTTDSRGVRWHWNAPRATLFSSLQTACLAAPQTCPFPASLVNYSLLAPKEHSCPFHEQKLPCASTPREGADEQGKEDGKGQGTHSCVQSYTFFVEKILQVSQEYWKLIVSILLNSGLYDMHLKGGNSDPCASILLDNGNSNTFQSASRWWIFGCSSQI